MTQPEQPHTPAQAPPPHDAEDLGFALPPPATTSRVWVILVLVGIVGGAFAYGFAKHQSARADVPPPAIVAGEAKATRVQVITAKALTSDQAIDLPATVRALEETKLYPRTSGYVKAWHVDIGDKVAAGALLAEIESPDVDAQLGQARAQLAAARAAVKQAAAQRDYSKSNSTRYQGLADQQLVAKQQLEQTQAQAATDEANVAAAEATATAADANVHRLTELVAFEKVTAPFAGTITTRTIDRGALVTAGNTTPMFTLVAIDPVRVFIDVPQTIAPSIKPGAAVAVTVREYPNRPFVGTVARAAGALDPDLHTESTEVRVPNPDGALLPGMFVRAALSLPAPHRVLEIPASALFNDALGLRVATVDAGHKVKYVKVTIERDMGGTIQIATGLTGDEKIIKVAVPSLGDGDPVEIAE